MGERYPSPTPFFFIIAPMVAVQKNTFYSKCALLTLAVQYFKAQFSEKKERKERHASKFIEKKSKCGLFKILSSSDSPTIGTGHIQII